jgi:hypothetical protein
MDEGLRLVTVGLDQYRTLRTPPIFWPLVRYTQATAYLNAGLQADGLALIDEALSLAATDDTVAPLMFILRGDLCLLDPNRDPAAATQAYESAFAGAGRVNARLPQLRAALKLARVAADSELAERIEVVRQLHATFTEGFETSDLIDAAEAIVER